MSCFNQNHPVHNACMSQCKQYLLCYEDFQVVFCDGPHRSQTEGCLTLTGRFMVVLGQIVGVWQMCVWGPDTPLIVVIHPRALCVCVHVCQQHRKRESLGARAGYDLSFLLVHSLCPSFTMHGSLSRVECRQRGSKLITQCAGNVSRASASSLETSEGPFQLELLNIPELM